MYNNKIISNNKIIILQKFKRRQKSLKIPITWICYGFCCIIRDI